MAGDSPTQAKSALYPADVVGVQLEALTTAVTKLNTFPFCL